jgi:hypothetical protein
MESIYKDMFGSSHLLAEQIRGHLFNLIGPEGLMLVIIDTDRRLQSSHPGRVGFLLGENERLVEEICNRLDDGEDPLVIKVKGGCVAACQLGTERVHCGYLLVYLEGYAPETVGANMSLVEMILAQAQLVCELVEKNNQLHHLKLLHLSRTSEVLTR